MAESQPIEATEPRNYSSDITDQDGQDGIVEEGTEKKPDVEDLNSMTDEQLEQAIMEMQEKIKQRKEQQEAIKRMIQEQEDEFLQVQGRNDVLEREYDVSKRGYDKAHRQLRTLLSSKEDLFVKLQKI